jgi:hypothetical protein
MLTKLFDHGSCGWNESLRFGEHNYAQSALMRNPERHHSVPGRLVIDDRAAARIGESVSQHARLASAQAECRHVGRNRPGIDGKQPIRLGQGLDSRVGWSFALYLQDGCVGYHHGRSQSLQHICNVHGTSTPKVNQQKVSFTLKIVSGNMQRELSNQWLGGKASGEPIRCERCQQQ